MYPARREYRLSVVRLGVLHSSKYLGIFEESRVPKKTVYSVGRWRDLSRERTSEEKARRRERGSEANASGLGTSHRRASYVDNQKTCCREKIYTGKIYGRRRRRSRRRPVRDDDYRAVLNADVHVCCARLMSLSGHWILGWPRTVAFSIFLVIFSRRVREIATQLTAANDRADVA